MTCFVINPTAKTITPVPWDGGLDGDPSADRF